MSEPLIAISKRQALLFATFLVAYEFLTYMANDMIMPGMIHVAQSFHAPESVVASSLTVYMLGGASLQIILGPLSDSFGRRPMMIIGGVLFFFFTVVIACSQSINQFLIARFFEGMGLCFIGVIGYATIQELFEEMDAIRLIAIMANISILAPLLGPLFGAIVIYYSSWRYIFLGISVGALIALWGLWNYMPEPIGSIKKNGECIEKTDFSFAAICSTYTALLKNSTFCWTALAIAMLGIPCLIWIALAPLIMIIEAKLTVIHYALWQLPVFGATILGNWYLHRLTFKHSTTQIITYGCWIMAVSAFLISFLPYFFGNDYYYLLPGIIIYFFALSIINAPLNRLCLYTTQLSKGTVSALISLCVMVIGAAGTEIGNFCYKNHSNLHFSLYCNATQILFFVSLSLAYYFNKRQKHNIL